MKNISGEDLFGKGIPGNLNKKSLMKMKKGEREETVETNLPFLVDFFFSAKGKERKYLNDVYDLIGSEKAFMMPLAKIMGTGKKKGLKLDNIPKGLHVLIMDSIDAVRNAYEERSRRFGGNTSSYNNDEIASAMEERISHLESLITLLVSKETKKLVKFGMEDRFASMLARCFVPAKYLNVHNVGKYMYRLNRTLVEIQKRSMIKNDDDNETYTNEAGINVADDGNLLAIYEKFLRKVKRNVLLAALTSVLLERRSKAVDNFNKPQLAMYRTISRVVCDLLEGNAVLNLTGEKLKKKELKEHMISKKELRKILQAYSERRSEDSRHGNDGPRRITITNLSDEVYPRLLSAFSSESKNMAKSVLEGDFDREKQEQNNNNNNGNDRNKNNNDRKNRNNNNNNGKNNKK